MVKAGQPGRAVCIDVAVRVAAALQADLPRGALEVARARRLGLAGFQATTSGAGLAGETPGKKAVWRARLTPTVDLSEVADAVGVTRGVGRRQLSGAQTQAVRAGQARVTGVARVARTPRGTGVTVNAQARRRVAPVPAVAVCRVKARATFVALRIDAHLTLDAGQTEVAAARQAGAPRLTRSATRGDAEPTGARAVRVVAQATPTAHAADVAGGTAHGLAQPALADQLFASCIGRAAVLSRTPAPLGASLAGPGVVRRRATTTARQQADQTCQQHATARLEVRNHCLDPLEPKNYFTTTDAAASFAPFTSTHVALTTDNPAADPDASAS